MVSARRVAGACPECTTWIGHSKGAAVDEMMEPSIGRAQNYARGKTPAVGNSPKAGEEIGKVAQQFDRQKISNKRRFCGRLYPEVGKRGRAGFYSARRTAPPSTGIAAPLM